MSKFKDYKFLRGTSYVSLNLRQWGLIIVGITLLFLCSTCRKEHVAPVNQLVKDLFCFKEGSEWTYYDSVSQTTQKMVVTNYEVTRIGAKYAYRKTKDWAEVIKMSISIENTEQSLFLNKVTSLESDEDQDNTLIHGSIFTPANAELYLHCDANNNFTYPKVIVTYLDTYSINETIYSDVYMFNTTDINYYVSKHIGFIQCVCNKFNLVLINKNIQQ